jgi:SAM-dependent methyltransferase
VLCRLLGELDLPAQGLVVDLGCSDGFVLAELRRRGVLPAAWRMDGYDHQQRLLREARARHLPAARFRRVDLNDVGSRVNEEGDLVLCLETLEHVGDYRAALEVAHHAVVPGGLLVLTLPNEVGVIGMVKLLGRPIVRRGAYEGFFSHPRQALRYGVTVAMYGDLERFRDPRRRGWGPHLGFDHRRVTSYLTGRFVDTGLWTLERSARSGLGSNVFLVARRRSDDAADGSTDVSLA